MKSVLSLIFLVGLCTSLKAQTNELTLTDTLSFVPTNGIMLRSMPVNVPSSHLLVSDEFSFELMTGGILDYFLTDRNFYPVKPLSLREYNPKSVSDFNAYIYKNYFLIDKRQ